MCSDAMYKIMEPHDNQIKLVTFLGVKNAMSVGPEHNRRVNVFLNFVCVTGFSLESTRLDMWS